MIPKSNYTGCQPGTYTIEQLAELLHCSLRHARRLDAEGAIPGRLTFGRLVRFSRRKVDSWLDGEISTSHRNHPK